VLFPVAAVLIRKREPAACMRAFLNNQFVGLVVFVGILLQYLVRRLKRYAPHHHFFFNPT